ncbi:hypothetical protein SAMN02745883_00369 [Caminicella sporogenes DSM 14501]|uniref:Uncharacterized protein n=1 Tax=Caminicella sporogenes DSM 14501 TaxID=1121266 RepID=A0A1M6LW29_9FIRM|nr:hypothetical protein SAMN02745883_00369 [Caminicella sporogenes DSM 14501]
MLKALIKRGLLDFVLINLYCFDKRLYVIILYKIFSVEVAYAR